MPVTQTKARVVLPDIGDKALPLRPILNSNPFRVTRAWFRRTRYLRRFPIARRITAAASLSNLSRAVVGEVTAEVRYIGVVQMNHTLLVVLTRCTCGSPRIE
jgi:hypothetical protein